MTEQASIRIAVRSDEDDIMALCRQLEKENAIFPMSEDRVRQKLERTWIRAGGIIGLIGDPGDIRALIVLEMDQLWYSEEWMLMEVFNFVKQEHRRSNYAKQLIAFAKETAVKLDLPLFISILSTKRTEAKVRFYERQLPKAGAFFLFNAKTGLGDEAKA